MSSYELVYEFTSASLFPVLLGSTIDSLPLSGSLFCFHDLVRFGSIIDNFVGFYNLPLSGD